MERITLTVNEKDAGQRIDKWLATQKDWSRSQIQEWIKNGNVRIEGHRLKTKDKVASGAVVSINIPDPEPLDVMPENLSLDIIYEDGDVIVVNKPRGMVVHPASGHLTGTLVNGLLYHCHDLSGINGVMRPGIVHRIDKDTSGLLMVAKNDHAHQSLAGQLKAKTIQRKYKAIVHGVFKHSEGTIDAPIGRDQSNRKRMAVTEKHSKEAVTHFTVLETFHEYSYVACRLDTGRTHQIRVHMNYIGHSVAGDPKYGPKKTLDIEGQALHAAVLGFTHPRTGEELIFEAPLPGAMLQLLEKLKKQA
jgi:23S rRNA pseudouridine1911/1915/1917 synthase